MVDVLSARQRQWWWWAVSLLLGFTLYGFFVAPRLLRAVLVWQLPKQLHRDVAIAKVKLNPYALSVAIDGLVVREPSGGTFLAWDEVYVNVGLSSPFRREIVLNAVVVSNAFAHVQVNHDGTFNFSDLLQKFAGNESPKKETKPVTLRIGHLQVTGSKARYDDFTRTTPFSTTFGPINVDLRGFSTRPDNKNPYGFTAVSESGEKFSWRGFFYLGPIRSSGEFALENIALKKYAPYYDDFVNLTLHDGRVDVRASYNVELTDRLTVAQVSNTTVTVRALKIAEKGAATNVVEIPQLTVADTFVDVVRQVADVGTFSASGGRLDVRRLDDGTINLLKLVTPPVRAHPTNTTGETPVPQNWVATVRQSRIEDWGFHVTGLYGEQNVTWDALRFTGVRAQTAPLALFVGEIVLTNGALHYADNSLPKPAAVEMSRLNATVNGLSTDPGARAELRATGRIGNFGTLDVTGKINPLNLDAATALQAELHQMDLVPVGPYAGKYAGYDVRKGKLSVAVKYAIEHRQLNAQNSIVVDQFTFGDKTDSPDAVKLPVKLAVAILKDRNGKIELDVPVEGRIDDPKFRYWGAVWHVLGTLFTRIFTAPFALLGSMFGGGGEELGWQDFTPGSAELIPDQAKKLDTIIKAMTERPGLNLEIEGSIDPVKDVEPLQRQKLARLLTTMRAQREPGNTNALNQTEYASYLREAYAAALPKLLALEAAAAATNQAAVTGTNFSSNVANLLPPGAKPPPKEVRATQARKAAAELTVPEMERQYLALVELTTDDYRQLAADRARAVMAYVRQKSQIESDRIALAEKPAQPVATKGAHTYLNLE